jgi:flavin prenyltransferase
MSKPLVLAITGASGAVYGQRLLEVLLQTDRTIHLIISDSGRLVLQHELGLTIDLNRFSVDQLLPNHAFDVGSVSKQVHYYHYKDFMAPIASGSHKTAGMIVCPCSGSTVSGIATAASQNLIQRAADVHLKEKRPLILVPRETPLSLIQIDNLRTACAAGATILPASPGFYHGSESVSQLVDFIVARILDHLDIEHSLMRRWGAED